jgi:2-polyprenyl-3-methyl-5-hydroxy-6-metoxy-1,4-benzoquinol methylase
LVNRQPNNGYICCPVLYVFPSTIHEKHEENIFASPSEVGVVTLTYGGRTFYDPCGLLLRHIEDRLMRLTYKGVLSLLATPITYLYYLLGYIVARIKARNHINKKGPFIDKPCICGSSEYDMHLDYDEHKILVCCNCTLKRNYPDPASGVLGKDLQRCYETDLNLHQHQMFLLHHIMTLVDGLPCPRILDIGCSTGKMMMYLKTSGFANVYGIEMNHWAVRICRQKGLLVDDKDIEDVSYSFRFDVIYMCHVLEHIQDPKVFLRTVKSKMSDNGYLVIAVPNIGGIQAKKSNWIGYQFDQHYWHFTPETLKNVGGSVGLRFHDMVTLDGIFARLYSALNIDNDSLIMTFRNG